MKKAIANDQVVGYTEIKLLLWEASGEGGIRTLDPGLPSTRVPGELLKPLGHLSSPRPNTTAC